MTPSPPKKVPLLFLLVTAFLFAMGISLVFPVLPYIVAKYVPQISQQAAVIGVLGATYAFISFSRLRCWVPSVTPTDAAPS